MKPLTNTHPLEKGGFLCRVKRNSLCHNFPRAEPRPSKIPPKFMCLIYSWTGNTPSLSLSVFSCSTSPYFVTIFALHPIPAHPKIPPKSFPHSKISPRYTFAFILKRDSFHKCCQVSPQPFPFQKHCRPLWKVDFIHGRLVRERQKSHSFAGLSKI